MIVSSEPCIRERSQRRSFPSVLIAISLSFTLILLSLCRNSFGQVELPQNTASHAVLTVKTVSFRSASLNREMRYRIYLPRNYAQASVHFPVLYLLHGIYGNYTDWDTQSHLRRYAENLDLIIVMPDGGNSWYVNSATDPQDRFEDYLTKDLIEEVDARYRTIPRREKRAIAGLSMGGYASLNMALKHPELFAFAGDLSGALNAPSDLGARQPAFQASLLAAFGSPGSVTRSENDIFSWLERADVSKLPYIYIACGRSDVFRDLNHQFATELEARHARYEAHELPGGHDWKFWDSSAKNLLVAVMKALSG